MAGNAGRLRLKWAFGLQNTDTSYTQPTAAGDRCSSPAPTDIYSLDAGTTVWTFKTEEFVRGSVSSAAVNQRLLAFFGDVGANIMRSMHRELIWKVHVEDHPLAQITGAVTFYGERLYVPLREPNPPRHSVESIRAVRQLMSQLSASIIEGS
ncbi:MAG: hypothetical protein JO307_02690 [Bryobacterales bacterium]|nr:hypothetical protein [Bryobacterales bacterium]MBV9398359.1 hypothetical protein [Bryobacterales bacterium]